VLPLPLPLLPLLPPLPPPLPPMTPLCSFSEAQSQLLSEYYKHKVLLIGLERTDCTAFLPPAWHMQR
jgi:hypothetical protein